MKCPTYTALHNDTTVYFTVYFEVSYGYFIIILQLLFIEVGLNAAVLTKTLEKIYKPFEQLTTVPRKQIFFSTIWLEFPSEILKRKLSQIIRKYYPQF